MSQHFNPRAFEQAVLKQEPGTVTYELTRPLNQTDVDNIAARIQTAFGDEKGVMMHRKPFGLEIKVTVYLVD